MDWYTQTDHAIVREIGRRIKQYRLNQNLTQKEVADLAGIHRTTLSALENGTASTLITLVQVLRALGEMDLFEGFLPDPGPSPIQMAKLQGKARQRASGERKTSNEGEAW